MSISDGQRKPLGDWTKGRELSAKNLQEAIPVLRQILATISTPQQAVNQSKGFALYRVTEVVDLDLEPLTWSIKAVLVNDTLNEDTPPILEAVSDELTMKLPAGTYGVAVGDIVTNAVGKKDPYSLLVYPISHIALTYKATADEAAGEITGKPMELDLGVVGDEQTFKVFPDA